MSMIRIVRTITIGALVCAAVSGWALSQELDPTQTEIDAFLRADEDADQNLDQPEFKIFVDFMAEAGQTTARTIRFFGVYEFAFGIVDENENGLLEPMELREADDGYRAGE